MLPQQKILYIYCFKKTTYLAAQVVAVACKIFILACEIFVASCRVLCRRARFFSCGAWA